MFQFRHSMALAMVVSGMALSPFVAGCGTSSPPAPVTPGQTAGAPPVGPNGRPPVPGQPGQAPSLFGVWVTGCLPNELAEENGFFREQYVFSRNSTFSHTRSSFADSACQTRASRNNVIDGTFQVGPQVQAKFEGLDVVNAHFNDTEGSAPTLKLAISAPAESAGMADSVFFFNGQSLYMGVLSYEDRGRQGADSAIDLSKEFKLYRAL